MTINAPGSVLLLLYQLVAEEHGVAGDQLTGTIQNDVLKEYIARGTYIYPPKRVAAAGRRHVRLLPQAEMPRWNTISISGYHMAEAGATPVQEIAFTLANAMEYVRAAQAAGLEVDEFAPRLSFFFVARTTLLEEVAKFRAARRIWARVMREEFGAKNPKSHDAALPHPDRGRAADGAAAGGQPRPGRAAGSRRGARRHAVPAHQLLRRGDRAPTEKAARLALRTQQVIAYETDVTKTVDPFAGSYVVEAMTDEIEEAALELMQAVEDKGGAVAAIEEGFQKSEIERCAYRIALEIDSRERTVVGLNRFPLDHEDHYEPLRVDPTIEADQGRGSRPCGPTVTTTRSTAALAACRSGPRHRQRALPDEGGAPARATGGEVAHALREVWGVYSPARPSDPSAVCRVPGPAGAVRPPVVHVPETRLRTPFRGFDPVSRPGGAMRPIRASGPARHPART